MEEINCIFCGTASSHVLIEENGYTGRKCETCGLVYISPRPSLQEILELYARDGANISADSHISNPASKRINARHHLKIVRSFIRDGDLLEIGAGGGYFLDEARKLGFNPHGLELNPVQAHFVRSELGIPCEQSAIGASVFGGKKFDVVYHCDVISHFYDPISEFERTREAMKDNAFLIFETGTLGDEKYLGHFQTFQYPDHLFFFTEDSLKRLLETTGFRLIRIYRYSMLPQKLILEALSSLLAPARRHARETSSSAKGSGYAGSARSRASLKTVVRRIPGLAYRYFRHALRYKIGRIALKRGRPQTMIVVAAKQA